MTKWAACVPRQVMKLTLPADAAVPVRLGAFYLKLLVLVLVASVNVVRPDDHVGDFTCLHEWKSLEPHLRGSGSRPSQRIPCFHYRSPYQKSAGKLKLAALLPLYKATVEDLPTAECLYPRHDLMVQLVEAIRLIMDAAAQKDGRLAKLIDGIEILDTCGLTRTALEAVNIVNTRSRLSQNTCHHFPVVSGDGHVVNMSAKGHCPGDQDVKAVRVGAVLGPALSKELASVTTALSVHGLPHVSYWSTSNSYRLKWEFPYLFRTATTDAYTVEAIVDILEHFGWKYIALLQGGVAQADASMADEIRLRLRIKGICIAYHESFQRHNDVKMREIAGKLVNPPGKTHADKTIAVVCVAGYLYMERLFQVMKMMAAKDSVFASDLAASHIVWIGNDGWLFKAVEILPPVPECAHSTTSLGRHSFLGPAFKVPPNFTEGNSAFLKEFQAHLHNTKVTSQTVRGNPWLAVAWQDKFNCCLTFLPSVPACPPCNTSQSLGSVFSSLAQPISSGSLWLGLSSAVQLLEDAYSDVLVGNQDVFSVRNSDVLSKMQNLTFECDGAVSKRCRVFEDHQDTLAAFGIYAIVFDGCQRHLEEVGYWSDSIGSSPSLRLSLVFLDWNKTNPSVSIWATGNRRFPVSSCSVQCGLGKYPLHSTLYNVDGWQGCCWECLSCSADRYSANDSCHSCPSDQVINLERTGCVQLKVFYYSYSHPAVEVTVILAALGIAFAVFVGLVFCANCRSLFIVKAGLGQSLILLLCILYGLAVVCGAFVEPDSKHCSFRQLSLAAVWCATHILLTSRFLRLVALATDPLLNKGWLWKIANLTARNFSRQLLAFVSQCLVIGGIAAPVTFFYPPGLGENTILSEERRHVFCSHPLYLELTIIVIVAALLLVFLIVAISYRKLKMGEHHKFSTGGPNEVTLLFCLAIGLASLYGSVVIILYLTTRAVLALALAMALTIKLLALLGFIYMPYVVAVLKWNRLSEHARLNKQYHHLAMQQKNRAKEYSLSKSARSSLDQPSITSQIYLRGGQQDLSNAGTPDLLPCAEEASLVTKSEGPSQRASESSANSTEKPSLSSPFSAESVFQQTDSFKRRDYIYWEESL